MAELKTRATALSVDTFLKGIADDERRADALAVCKLMAKVTGEKPVMWGSAIVGFGKRKLRYPDGREVDWMRVAFSPRKANTVFYVGVGEQQQAELLARLGKHKLGKGCLYVRRLADVDVKVLEQLIKQAARRAAGD